MFALTNNLITGSSIYAAQAQEVLGVRGHFDYVERGIRLVNAQAEGNQALVTRLMNESAIIPADAWRELDSITTRVMRHDEGDAYMADLRPLAKPINIGKLAHLTRVSSDAGSVKRSMSGQKAIPMDKVQYDYRGTPIPIFDSGYGREWREMMTFNTESFDALSDDQEAHTAKIKSDMADYVLDGDASIIAGGYEGYGIRTHPLSNSINIGAAGANINLTASATDAEDIENFVNTVIGAAMDANHLTGYKLNLYISPEIARNWDRPYSGATGFKEGSIRDVLAKNRRINKIVDTFKLSGNEFFAFVPNAQFIRPLMAMAVSTVPVPRTGPRDNYQFLVSGAMGIEIRGDYNNRSGVFYSVSV